MCYRRTMLTIRCYGVSIRCGFAICGNMPTTLIDSRTEPGFLRAVVDHLINWEHIALCLQGLKERHAA